MHENSEKIVVGDKEKHQKRICSQKLLAAFYVSLCIWKLFFSPECLRAKDTQHNVEREQYGILKQKMILPKHLLVPSPGCLSTEYKYCLSDLSAFNPRMSRDAEGLTKSSRTCQRLFVFDVDLGKGIPRTPTNQMKWPPTTKSERQKTWKETSEAVCATCDSST